MTQEDSTAPPLQRPPDSSSNSSNKTITNPILSSIHVVAKTGSAAVKTTEKAMKSTAKATTKATKSVAKTVTNLISTDDDEAKRRWKELCSIERRRRAILKRAEEPFWRSLLHWDGTVLDHLKTDSVLWITMGLYIATRVLAREGLPDFVAGLDNNNNNNNKIGM
jgi:hypothetical protein